MKPAVTTARPTTAYNVHVPKADEDSPSARELVGPFCRIGCRHTQTHVSEASQRHYLHHNHDGLQYLLAAVCEDAHPLLQTERAPLLHRETDSPTFGHLSTQNNHVHIIHLKWSYKK